MNDCALVSVLVPVYNHERFILRCLDSIRDCGYPRLEVLILDDGSTDESFSIVQRWAKENERAFERIGTFQQPNQGIPATFNRLVSLARGEMVTFVASDDYLLKGGVEIRVAALERHLEWAAVFGDCIVVDEGDAVLHESGLTDLHEAYKPALRHSEFRARELAIRWSAPGPIFLARRWIYDDAAGIGGYDERLSVEDRDFYLRLLARGLLGFVDAPVAAYRLVSSSASRSPQRRAVHLQALAATEEKHLSSFHGMTRAAIWLRWHIGRLRLTSGAPDWLREAQTKLLFRALSGLHMIHRLDFLIRTGGKPG